VEIHIRGAREHNLRDVDVDLGDGLTVITGVSGSGKTSLAFDVLYHEARRRFIEIYELGGRHRPAPAEVGRITGLGPAVAVGQNLLNRNPNSTLATASGLHPLLRLLYARFGQRHCARCGAALALSTADEIVERLAQAAAAGPTTAWAPLLRDARGSHRTLLALLAAELGTEALRVDGAPWDGAPLEPGAAHDLDVRLAELDEATPLATGRGAVERAAALGAVAVAAEGAADGRAADGRAADGGQIWTWAPLCVRCGAPFGALRPLHLHTPCPHCQGAGCERCGGTGLLPEAAAVRWAGLRLPDLLALSAGRARALFASAATLLPPSAARLRQEIDRRLEALEAVGLGYVALDRPAPTLSRGEAQRVRLAVALTSRLEDILHVLDEPTVGQHPADVARLLPALRRLPGPVVYVEHDRLAAAEADRAVDLGPAPATKGGGCSTAARPPACGPRTRPPGATLACAGGWPGRPHAPRRRRSSPCAAPSCATWPASTCPSPWPA
jgi:excinuclease ABC subunit A